MMNKLMSNLTVKKILVCSQVNYNDIYFKLNQYVGHVTSIGQDADYIEQIFLPLHENKKQEIILQLWKYEPQRIIKYWIFNYQQLNFEGFMLISQEQNWKIYFENIIPKKKPKQKIQFQAMSETSKITLKTKQALKRQINNNLSKQVKKNRKCNYRSPTSISISNSISKKSFSKNKIWPSLTNLTRHSYTESEISYGIFQKPNSDYKYQEKHKVNIVN